MRFKINLIKLIYENTWVLDLERLENFKFVRLRTRGGIRVDERFGKNG